MRRLAVSLVLLLTACDVASSGDSTADGGDIASQVCARYSACNVPFPNCVPEVRAEVLTSACQSALLSASCDDLSTQDPTGILTPCFVPCGSPGMAVCNDDGTLSTCDTATMYAHSTNCAAHCAALGQTYSGTCGDSYNGQASPNGAPICWCQ